MERDKDRGKNGEGQGSKEGWRGTRTKGRIERDGQGPREGWRGRRVKGRILRDKDQGKDREGQGSR